MGYSVDPDQTTVTFRFNKVISYQEVSSVDPDQAARIYKLDLHWLLMEYKPSSVHF
jgi:hypothetical protein